MASPGLLIGELARSAGVGVETIRFYERRGLLEAPPRGASGYRRFPPAAAARLRFIHQAQQLGFSLREVADLLSLQVAAGATCAEVRERARAKLVEVRARQRSLARIGRALERLIERCRGDVPAGQCAILAALAEDDAPRRRPGGGVVRRPRGRR